MFRLLIFCPTVAWSSREFNSHRPTRRDYTVTSHRIGRCKLGITRLAARWWMDACQCSVVPIYRALRIRGRVVTTSTGWLSSVDTTDSVTTWSVETDAGRDALAPAPTPTYDQVPTVDCWPRVRPSVSFQCIFGTQWPLTLIFACLRVMTVGCRGLQVIVVGQTQGLVRLQSTTICSVLGNAVGLAFVLDRGQHSSVSANEFGTRFTKMLFRLLICRCSLVVWYE